MQLGAGHAALRCSPRIMWRAATIARAAFGRPLINTALSRGLVPPIIVHAAAITSPIFSAVQQAESPFNGAKDLKVALGLAAGAGLLLGDVEQAECMPKRKNVGGGGKAAAAPAKKKKAGPAFSAIEAALQPAQLEEDEYNMESLVADRLVGGKREYGLSSGRLLLN